MKTKTDIGAAGNNAAAQDKETADNTAYVFPLKKINFIIMGIAGLMIVLGFVLMAGGGTTDGSFNPEVFSTMRIVIAPTMAFLGFVLMGVGIMWPSRDKDVDAGVNE